MEAAVRDLRRHVRPLPFECAVLLLQGAEPWARIKRAFMKRSRRLTFIRIGWRAYPSVRSTRLSSSAIRRKSGSSAWFMQ